MAERRMFAKTIVLSDAFLDLPMSARCLYFTLGMLADDDGFVNAPRGIMRQCGASDDDMKILLSKKFVLLFDSGVIVIKHWRINNYLQKDRYKETKYLEEKAELTVGDDGNYHRKDPSETMYTQDCIHNDVYTGKDSIGKGRLGEDRLVQDNNNKSIFLSESEKTEKIAHYRDMLGTYARLGFDPHGVYELAAAEGLTREEIDGS